ncbi:hypothetical protein NDU88_007367 [Pleurodeles waltl]|uniref:Uncharacterized protein n=1 Tax=Pleurodeles waltl TaxID=8319 RepID=A0AAV7U091_PLEWA|nr:hypothetical protein NDU88_007367 [Pleurodeles waltl]
MPPERSPATSRFTCTTNSAFSVLSLPVPGHRPDNGPRSARHRARVPRARRPPLIVVKRNLQQSLLGPRVNPCLLLGLAYIVYTCNLPGPAVMSSYIHHHQTQPTAELAAFLVEPWLFHACC